MPPQPSTPSPTPGPYHHPRPLYPLLAAWIVGVAAGDRWPDFAPTAVAVAVVGVLGSVAGICSRRGGRWQPAALFFALGFLSIQPWNRSAPGSAFIGPFLDGGVCTVTGTVSDRPRRYPGRTRFILRVERLAGRTDTADRHRARLRVTVNGEDPGLRRGDRIRLSGRIRSFHNFDNPGGFDYRRYMRHRRVAGSISLWGGRPTLIRKKERSSLAERLHAAICAHIAASSDPEEAGAVFAALILGERTRIPPELGEAFHRAGVGHLLAISGVHVGIVAAIFFWACRALYCRIGYFLWKGWVRKAAAATAFFPVLGYAFLSGMSPSTQRAVLMVGAGLLALLLERERDMLHAVAMAGLIIATVHPPSVFSVSFQLSFAAVLAVIAGASLVGKPSRPRGSTIRRWLYRMASLAWVSLLAFFGTLPLVTAYFNQLSLAGPIANLFYIPAVGFVAVPLGLAAVAAAPVSPPLAGLLVELDVQLLAALLDTMKWVARMPYAAVKTPTPGWVEIFCYYAGGSLMLSWWRRRKTAVAGEPSAAVHSLGPRGLVWGSILVIALAVGDALYWCRERFWRDDLRLTVMDVGQGSAALLELPGGLVVLVDGGGFSDNSRFDVGASVVAPFLWRKKIRTLDLVVLSHPNADHMNGLLFVLRHFRVRELWTNGEPSETAGYQRFRKIVEDKKIFEPEFSRLPRRRRMGGATVTIGNPPPDFFGRSRFEPWRNKNNNSLVLHIRFGRVSFLLPGDVMAAAESEMVQSTGEQMAAHILIAPHHGSRSSNTELFLDTVRPWVAVVSAGMNNRFGFPHPIVQQRYRRRGVPLLRCDRDGAVLCSSDGKSFRLTTFLLSRHRDSPPPVRWEAFIGEGPNDPGEPPTGRENGPDGEKSRRRPLPNRQEREEECRSATSVATETAW